MAELLRLLEAFAIALVPSLAFCRLVMAFGVMDKPDEARKREVHEAAVPTSGGLGFGLAVALAIAFATGWSRDRTLLEIEAGGFAMLLVGFYDDRFKLAAKVKLALMVAICVLLAVLGLRVDVLQPWPGIVWALPALVGAVGSILWLLVLVNAVNFMDGANGLSMGMGFIASLGLAICCVLAGADLLAIAAVALAGALAGFLLWNVRGRLFAGDSGALFVGALLGALSLALVRVRPDWLFVPAILTLPWLTDVILTVAWRARRGKRIFDAHRDHVYQIAMKAGLKHWQVAAIHAVWALNAVGFAVISAVAGGYVPLIAFLILLALSVWIHGQVRKSGERAGLVGADLA